MSPFAKKKKKKYFDLFEDISFAGIRAKINHDDREYESLILEEFHISVQRRANNSPILSTRGSRNFEQSVRIFRCRCKKKHSLKRALYWFKNKQPRRTYRV